MLAQLQRENGRGAHVAPTPVNITSIGAESQRISRLDRIHDESSQ